MDQSDYALSKFAPWNAERAGLKHNWFDRLGEIIQTTPDGAATPDSLRRWSQDYERLRAWLSDTFEALSPAQVLDLPAFCVWPEEFRQQSRRWLHKRFQCAFPHLETLIKQCQERLDELDKELRPHLKSGVFSLSGEGRGQLKKMFQEAAAFLRKLPEQVVWPEPQLDEGLARVLIIDDLLGRGIDGKGIALAPSAVRQLSEIRRSFCQQFHLLDDADSQNTTGHPIARAFFCSGQRWDPDKGFENDLNVIRRCIEGDEGIGDSSAPPWALVLLDVLFNTGKPDEHGRGPHDSHFGVTHILPWLRSRFPHLPVVVLTTEGSKETIRQAARFDADYLHRAGASYADLLVHLVKSERATPDQLRAAMEIPEAFIAADRKMIEVLFEAWLAAHDRDGRSVLILGETGVGKEELAKFIHHLSPRADGPLEFVNCAQFNKELAGSELFGFYKGAFSTAARDTKGFFHLADKGTLVLDEFADLDREVQSKLLRIMENERASARRVEPVGQPQQNSYLPKFVNTRIICCTSQNLDLVREDLLNRTPLRIIIPPLDERRDDILPLARHFLSSSAHLGAAGLELDPEAADFLQSARYEGNVRMLRDVIKKAAVGKGDRNILLRHDIERAYNSVRKDLFAQRGKPQVASRQSSAEITPSLKGEQAQLTTPCQAAAAVLKSSADGRNWNEMTKAQLDELDAALSGRMWEALATLLEWAFFRSHDAPTVAEYITGERGKGRAPADFVKRLMKLDKRISDRLASSTYLPENERLAQIMRSSRDDEK